MHYKNDFAVMLWSMARTMINDKPPRGGLRSPPGGRPPKQPEERKVKISITISKDVQTWLQAQRNRPNEPISQVIERKLRELAD
jgi:hypothetical protein